MTKQQDEAEIIVTPELRQEILDLKMGNLLTIRKALKGRSKTKKALAIRKYALSKGGELWI